jgi:Glycosyl hydrolase family 26
LRKWALVGALVVLPVALYLAFPVQASGGRAPAGRVLFGVHIDWSSDSPAAYIRRSGVRPAQFGAFIHYPIDHSATPTLLDMANAIAAVHADMFLTLEPSGGLPTVNTANAREFALTLRKIKHRGVTVYVRFGQEMNGSWYIWGQKPAAYIQAFRIVADAVHAIAPGNLMVWSPNYGGGYPFAGGGYGAVAGSGDFAALDTNHDGKLSMADDMYAPYYPGDSYVDWVGLTLYHFGLVYPWGENDVPDQGKFVRQLQGDYNGPEGDERGVPNFYTEFAVRHGKPMALSETGALYNMTRRDGAAEAAIKCSWMDQVFDPANASQFPQLRMQNWFEYHKVEREKYGRIDWRATFQPAVLACLKDHLKAGKFVFARRR